MLELATQLEEKLLKVGKNPLYAGAGEGGFCPVRNWKEMGSGRPLWKVDERTHEVYGLSTAEVPDCDREVAIYVDTKANYLTWSDYSATRTADAGQAVSYGNIRYQHTSVIAGKVNRVDYFDAKKQIWLLTQPVDDKMWDQLAEGFLTGYSHAGRYQYRRCFECSHPLQQGYYCPECRKEVLAGYAPILTEVSYVDRPCLSIATFAFVKSDGSVEMRKFAPPAAKKVLVDLHEVARMARASITQAIEELAKAQEKPKCPHCGSKNYSLKPPDFETAHCEDCDKNWNHGIVPGINDPGDSEKLDLTGRQVKISVPEFAQLTEGPMIGEVIAHYEGTLKAGGSAGWRLDVECLKQGSGGHVNGMFRGIKVESAEGSHLIGLYPNQDVIDSNKRARTAKYSDDQPRDDNGRFAGGDPEAATATAYEASRRAVSSGKESDYRAAAAAHRNAASAHRTASQGSDLHAIRAGVHEGNARRMDAAATHAGKFGENPAGFGMFSDKAEQINLATLPSGFLILPETDAADVDWARSLTLPGNYSVTKVEETFSGLRLTVAPIPLEIETMTVEELRAVIKAELAAAGFAAGAANEQTIIKGVLLKLKKDEQMTCPDCGADIDVPDDLAEDVITCPECGEQVSVKCGKLFKTCGRTKRVAGEDLPPAAFLIVGNALNPDTWKLPTRFESVEKSKRHLRSALAQFAKTTADDTAWKKLVRLCKKHGVDVADADDAETSARVARAALHQDAEAFLAVHKDMSHISRLADILQAVRWLQQSCIFEGEYERDERDFAIAEQLFSWMEDGVSILQDIVEEETSELTEPMEVPALKVAALLNKGDSMKLDELLKAAKGLAGHFGKAAGHHEKMAGVHKSFHEAAAETHKAMAEHDGEEVGKVHKGFHAKMHKSHSSAAEKLHKGHMDLSDAMKSCAEASSALHDGAKAEGIDPDMQKAIDSLPTTLDSKLAPLVDNLTKALEKVTGLETGLASLQTEVTKLGNQPLNDATREVKFAGAKLKMIDREGKETEIEIEKGASEAPDALAFMK